MIVLVDIGNTRTKYLVEKLHTINERIVVDNVIITEQWLTQYWGAATQIVIASVKLGPLTDLICHWANKHKIDTSFIESEKSRFGIVNSYEQPKSLGVDRWLSFIGASVTFPNSGFIIIDAGTATTVDIVDQSGVHQGGWILSGINLLLSQLNNNTSKVKFEVSKCADVEFGKSTSECVNNAAWAATLSMINLGIKKAEAEFNIQHCILSGGNAERLLPFLHSSASKIQIEQHLIFKGLKRYLG